MSGGADSSLAAYALAYFGRARNMDLQITPIVIQVDKNPFQFEVVEGVLGTIEKILDIKFLKMAAYNLPENEQLIPKMRAIEGELLSSGTVTMIVSGATHFPRGTDFIPPQLGGPVENRKGKFPLIWDGPIYTPFINKDKKEIAFYYKEHDLMDSLFPKTRTCNRLFGNGVQHCGDCWSCRERFYGFGII